jgi:phosphoribosylformimino-5-aminoimidazole carboxamide ribonucleotide (ProFAR) isomerase
VKSYFDLGVERVVLGTAALRQPELVEQAALAYPGPDHHRRRRA